jgi:hypothetical protein
VYFNPLVEGTGSEAPVAAYADGREFSFSSETLHRFRMESEQFSGLRVGQQRFKS